MTSLLDDEWAGFEEDDRIDTDMIMERRHVTDSEEYENVVLKKRVKRDITRMSHIVPTFENYARDPQTHHQLKQVLGDSCERMMEDIHGRRYNRFPKKPSDYYYH